MNKLYIYLVLLVLVFAEPADQGTEGYYFSPHAISRQRQVHDALDKMSQKIHIDRTTYQRSSVNYTISNMSLEISYLDTKQTIQITGKDEVKVSGGKFELLYTFNYSKVDGGKTVQGYAWGTVVSDSFNYTKEIIFGQEGHLIWALNPGNQSYTDLTIPIRMRLKRMEPYSQGDEEALQEMLDRAMQLIQPSNIQHQFLSQFNSIMPMTLNNTLNSQVLGHEVDYTFHHSSQGQLNMTIIHNNYGFDLDPVDGYMVRYLTEIKDYPEPICNGKNVPEKHLSFELYGGSQQIHMNCLYQSILEYIQKKGWLDVKLDSTWECNAFQFYAGDLYDLISNLYLSVDPRELLEGECKSSNDHLQIKHGRDVIYNHYTVNIQYVCTVNSRDKNRRNIDVLRFTADVELTVAAQNLKTELDISIESGQVNMVSFQPVGDFYVSNLKLAMFKINQILQKLKGVRVFGTGFPLVPHEFPKNYITQDYVIYYDSSHTSSPNKILQK